MNVSLAAQLLSSSVTDMNQSAIVDEEMTVYFGNKVVYNHIADLCEKRNDVIDIANGKEGSQHSPDNGVERQKSLLNVLAWFSRWKALHNERIEAKDANEFIFLKMRLIFAPGCCYWNTLL